MIFFSRLRRDCNRTIANDTDFPPGASAFLLGSAGLLASMPLTWLFLSAAATTTIAATALLAFGLPATIGFIWRAKTGYEEDKHRIINNNITFIGDTRDVGMVVNSLRSIRGIAWDFQHAAQVPEKARLRIDAFVHDMEQAALRVAAFRGTQPLDSIPVMRPVVGPDGTRDEVIGHVPARKQQNQNTGIPGKS